MRGASHARRTGRALLVAGGVVITVAVAVVWWRGGAAPAGRAPERAAPRAPEREPAAGGRTAVPLPTGSAILELELLDDAGAPADGTVCWIATESPPSTPPIATHDVLPPGAVREPISGMARIRVPARRWIWLAARFGPAVTRFARVAPFLGVQRRTLRADGDGGVAHVFALDAELHGPLAGGTVELHPRPGRPADVVRATTDAHGYARVPLPLGSYLACAPGASPGDRPPHSATFLLDRLGSRAQALVTVAAAPPAATLWLSVRTPRDFRAPQTVRTFLQRVDGGRGDLVAIPHALGPGEREHRLSVRPGTYRFHTLPRGACSVAGGNEWIEVRAGEQRAAIALRAASQRTRLRLRSLGFHMLPVSVCAEPIDQVVETPLDLSYVGPRRWHRLAQDVALPPYPCRLTVVEHDRCWVARAPVLPGHAEVTVELVAAARLEVAWVEPSRGPPAAGTLLAETTHGTVARGMRRALVRVRGTLRPALRGTVIARPGPITLRGVARDRPDAAWRRQLALAAGTHRLEIVEDAAR